MIAAMTTGGMFRLVEHRPSIFNASETVAIWSARCGCCGRTFEIATPARTDHRTWHELFAVARCPSCRKARRAKA